jgi:hypothetical protein
VKNEGDRVLEGYLAELRQGLGRLPEPERAEIVAELRGHVLESAGGGGNPSGSSMAAALARLGPASELARQYLAESVLVRAEHSRSPWLLLKGLVRAATLSVAGLFALLGLLVGYGLALSLALAAVRKPMAPDRVGLWQVGDDAVSLTLGWGAPAAGREILGWWIVPLGLLAGVSVLLLTTWFGRGCVRRLRRSPFRRSS